MIVGVLLFNTSVGRFCVVNTYTSRHVGNEKIYDALRNYYHAVYKNNPDKLLPYMVFGPSSVYMQVYCIYGCILIIPSYAVILYLTVFTFKQLNVVRCVMASKTYQMQKQINRIMIIQVMQNTVL